MKKAISLIMAAVMLLTGLGAFGAAAGEEAVNLNLIRLLYGTEYDMTPIEKASASPFVKAKSPLVRASASFPASFDSRNNGWITPVKDQGVTGDCWAFSTISALESDSIIKNYTSLQNTDFSESHLVWFGERSASQTAGDHNINEGETYSAPHDRGGSWQFAVAALSKWSGIANESDFPFYPYDVEQMTLDEADRYNTGAGIVLNSAEIINADDERKEWIMNHGSLMGTIYYSDSYVAYRNSTCSYYCNYAGGANHGITIIGWNDNFPVANFNPRLAPSSPGAWLCKDSWGENYRDNGYFWLSYEDATLKTTVGYTVDRAGKYLNNYTYNGTYYEMALEHSNGAMIANIFTAKSHENLEAVSTYTMQDGVTLDINIYTGLTGTTSPQKGTLAATFSTTVAHAGYHTIELPSAVSLSPGKRFSVVIKYSHPSGSVFIPIEYDSGSDIHYTCTKGESMLRLPDTFAGWYDAIDAGVKNVYIQAFTNCRHSFAEDYAEATCTEEGHYTNTCIYCGMVESSYVIPKTDHVMGEWETEIKGAEIKSARHCIHCDYTESYAGYTLRTTSLDELADFIEQKSVMFLELFFRWLFRPILRGRTK